MDAYITSLIRTIVPMVVGSLATYLLSVGIALDANTTSGLVGGLTGLFSALYYAIARYTEIKYPQFGWLLGKKAVVKYTEPK